MAQIVPTLTTDNPQPPSYDYARTAPAVTFGCVMHFGIHECVGRTGKVVMEQFVNWSWISNSLYLGAIIWLMEGYSAQPSKRAIAFAASTQTAQWIFWRPIQLLIFSLPRPAPAQGAPF